MTHLTYVNFQHAHGDVYMHLLNMQANSFVILAWQRSPMWMSVLQAC